MKNLFRFFAIVICIFITKQSCAQNTTNLLKPGVNAYIGPAVGNTPYGYGLGLDLLLIANLSEQLTIDGSFGYARLLTKDTSPIADYDYLPLKIALKIFPLTNQFYFMGIVGAGFGIPKQAKTSFIFGGGIGYRISNAYDISIKYEAFEQDIYTSNYQPINGLIAINFGYHF